MEWSIPYAVDMLVLDGGRGGGGTLDIRAKGRCSRYLLEMQPFFIGIHDVLLLIIIISYVVNLDSKSEIHSLSKKKCENIEQEYGPYL